MCRNSALMSSLVLLLVLMQILLRQLSLFCNKYHEGHMPTFCQNSATVSSNIFTFNHIQLLEEIFLLTNSFSYLKYERISIKILLIKLYCFIFKMMKKAVKKTSPRRLEICLNLLPADLNRNSSIHKQSKALQLKNSPSKQKVRYSTNGKSIQTEYSLERGIIRLGSKKKLHSIEAKQNIKPVQLSSQIVNKKQSSISKSLSKYFQTSQNIKFMHLKKNKVSSFDSQGFKPQHRYKTETKNEDSDNKFEGISLRSNNSSQNKLRNSLLDLSRNKSLKTFFDRKDEKRDRSCSLNKQLKHAEPQRKLHSRLQKLKQYKFIQEYLSDYELEGIFNELQLANIPEIRWSLIIVDKVYQIMRKRESNDYSGEIIRKF